MGAQPAKGIRLRTNRPKGVVQAVEGKGQWSVLAATLENVGDRASDETASDCSTASCNRDVYARPDDDDNLSDCNCESHPEAEALMIFDWDDTLFPTSWIQKHGLLVDGVTISSEQEAQLKRMADSARSTLEKALAIGTVVIVTNAEQGWIEKSCKKFTPSLVGLMKKVDMVSARSTYEKYVDSPSEWKRLAFEYEIGQFYQSGSIHQQRNIVSLGDSFHELHALAAVTRNMANCYAKSVKLLEAPSIQQLIDQHGMLTGSLNDVVEHRGHLNIEMCAEHL